MHRNDRAIERRPKQEITGGKKNAQAQHGSFEPGHSFNAEPVSPEDHPQRDAQRSHDYVRDNHLDDLWDPGGEVHDENDGVSNQGGER